MILKRALGVGLLALTGVAVAQQGLRGPGPVKQARVPDAVDSSQAADRMYSAADRAALRAEAVAIEAKVRIARKPLPKNLPRKRVVHELPPDQLACPCCHQPRIQISGEVSEQLEYEPASSAKSPSDSRPERPRRCAPPPGSRSDGESHAAPDRSSVF